MRKIIIIGSGFSSLASACYLAAAGYDVTIVEKNSTIGGRARKLEKDGFTFDMGPTWYWMPDVFERFFGDFNKKSSDYYALKKLSPGYKVFFEDSAITIPDNLEGIYNVFEAEEPGSAKKLKKFLEQAADNYDIAIKDLVYKPAKSPLELVTPQTIARLNLFFGSISSTIRSKFKSPKLRQILEFPVLFLGAKPENTPAFYSFMNHADFTLGTWYPVGGMFAVVEAIESLAKELGVKFTFNAEVQSIETASQRVLGVQTNTGFLEADIVLSGADYHHTEQLLHKENRGYSATYWEGRTFAPSALLFYVGLNKKLENVEHHTLFFDQDFGQHAKDIYDVPKWPDKPLFYASFPSKTDASSAPEGNESAIFLIPLAPDLKDTPEMREQYFDMIIDRFERLTHQQIREHVVLKESYCVNDFKADYNSFKGNAYGMANTLLQTAFLRPKIKSKKIQHLYFTGQLTVPGPGVPPSLISGKIAADRIIQDTKTTIDYESIV